MTIANRPKTGDTSPALQIALSKRLQVGEHVVDVGALAVTTREQQPTVTAKAMAVLIELAREPGRTLTRDELLDLVWPDSLPTPEVLTQAIMELRRVLGDHWHTPRYIKTVPKLGYRLIASVRWLEVTSPSNSVSHNRDHELATLNSSASKWFLNCIGLT